MPKKSTKKTVLPDPLPNGEVLTDIAKKKWVLGPSIGVGGFGEIYSAAEFTEGNKKSLNYQYVVKIEPHGNGPLFCEMHFFMRNAKPDMIKKWCSEHDISTLGMPRYLGSGSHEHDGKKYRFLVMDKYGKDLWHIFLENKKQFPVSTVYRIGIQILEVLEYIHNNGYVHADIKGANILLGLTKQTQNQVYLVDFGLASHYTKKEFKPDPKKAHNGTIEYTSRDAHDGVATRRGDIEILAYNLVQWMGCTLPWEKNLTDPVSVHNSKKTNMDNINAFLNSCFGKKKIPGGISDFLMYVSKMKYDTEPDYNKLKSMLKTGIKSAGGSSSGPLDFKASASKHKSDNEDSGTPEKRQRLSPNKRTSKSKLTTVVEDDSKPKRRAKKVIEDLKENVSDEDEVQVKKTKAKKKVINGSSEPEMVVSNGYNAEMIRLQKKIAERNAIKPKTRKTKAASTSSSSESNLGDDIVDATPTPPQIRTPRRKNKIVSPDDLSDQELTPRRLLRQRR